MWTVCDLRKCCTCGLQMTSSLRHICSVRSMERKTNATVNSGTALVKCSFLVGFLLLFWSLVTLFLRRKNEQIETRKSSKVAGAAVWGRLRNGRVSRRSIPVRAGNLDGKRRGCVPKFQNSHVKCDGYGRVSRALVLFTTVRNVVDYWCAWKCILFCGGENGPSGLISG